jgi:hypothetical protein
MIIAGKGCHPVPSPIDLDASSDWKNSSLKKGFDFVRSFHSF